MIDLGFEAPLYVLPFDHRGSFQSGLFGWKGTLTEYGDDYARHIEAFAPTFCKVLVRYNPEGDPEMNRRQAGRLRGLSEYLRSTERRFMFELLVPAEQAELDELHGDARAYDRSRRPRHMVDASHELQDAGVEPDVRKIEGLDRAEDCAAVVAAARRAGRTAVSCIILGRGEDDVKVESWLSTAASVPGFIGFAVGRTTFWEALVGWRDGRTTREAAVAQIARRYAHWCELFAKPAAD
jgi:5-dehydro-2-deoxygluconokinase